MDRIMYRMWVSTQDRVVSFHPVAGYTLLEFLSQDQFFRCVDDYARQSYRYQ